MNDAKVRRRKKPQEGTARATVRTDGRTRTRADLISLSKARGAAGAGGGRFRTSCPSVRPAVHLPREKSPAGTHLNLTPRATLPHSIKDHILPSPPLSTQLNPTPNHRKVAKRCEVVATPTYLKTAIVAHSLPHSPVCLLNPSV